jgi:protein tyrosine phosphatase (PTP) superfamily phosphohydrolase (DUF442 family)
MKRITILIVLSMVCGAAAADLSDIPNYLEYTETFSSAGQPNQDQIQDAWVDGFERVIYLAFSDHGTSLEHEDRIAKELGMEYVNIPVNWGSPTASDFSLFASVMQSKSKKKTLVHCQANYRASAFSLLYRVIYEDVPVAVAKKDMNSVWIPNDVWTRLILEVLAQHGISSECEDCDWTPQQH